MFHWTEYAQTNAQPRPLSDKKDFGICSLIPELEPREVHTLGLHRPVDHQDLEEKRSQGPTLTHWTTYSKSSICPSQSHILGHLWNFNKFGLEDWSILLGRNPWS